MPRLIRHDADGPIKIEPQDKPIFICACGLSQNMPHCDGSHSYCRKNEQPGRVYVYNNERTEIVKDSAED